jgi:O-methyltransferase
MKKPIITVLRALRLNRLAGKLYYRTFHGFSPAGRELPDAVAKSLVHAKTSGILDAGDYCEFGIFKGYTLLHAQKTADDLDADRMHFYGFDSFEGLPAPSGADLVDEGHQPFYEGQYAASMGYVKRHLDAGGVDWNRTSLIPGYFSDSLAGGAGEQHGIDQIAVALVDCDLYSSTVDVLEFLEPRLVDGAVVMMDDWKSYGDAGDKGQPQATREFLDRAPRWKAEKLFDYGDFGRVFEFRCVV